MMERLSKANSGRFSELLTAIFLFVLANSSFATIIRVPADVATIQGAINASSSGDTVYVSPGTYVENINFSGKDILLKSTDGAAATVLEQADQNSAIVSFITSESRSAIINDFTLQNANLLPAVYCSDSKPTIVHCSIQNCDSDSVGAIWANQAAPAIVDNWIQNNKGTAYGAIYIFGCTDTTLVEQNKISKSWPNGLRIDACSAPVIVAGNTIQNNDSIGIYLKTITDGVRVERNVISGNLSVGINTMGICNGLEVVNNTLWENEFGILINFGVTNSLGINNIIAKSRDVGLKDNGGMFDYGVYWNNGSNYLFGTAPAPHDMFANPRFSNPAGANFELLCDSPCIDAGYGNPPDADGSLFDRGAIPFNHYANTPIAKNFSFDGEDAFQVISPNPTFVWSPVTSSTQIVKIDTLFCFQLPNNGEWICVTDTTITIQGGIQLGYEVEVGTDDDWTVAELMSTGQITSSDTIVSYSGPPFEARRTHFARVRLLDSSGWGCWRQMAFRCNVGPSVPIPTFPPDGKRLDARLIVLKVQRISDPDSDTIYCEFELYDDALLTNKVLETTVRQGASGQVETDTLDGLAANQDHWWRARSFDGHLYSDWSPTWRFRPGVPTTLEVPTNYSTMNEAIYSAVDGDTILVAPGIYAEQILMRGKAISLIGRDGSGATILRKASGSYNIISGLPNGQKHAKIKGFHFEVPSGAFNSSGNVVINDCCFTRLAEGNPGNPTVFLKGDLDMENCVFDGEAGIAVGCLLENSQQVSIRSCDFVISASDRYYELIVLRQNYPNPISLEICNNNLLATTPGNGIDVSVVASGTISNNTLVGFGKGIFVANQNSIDIRNNIFANCATTAIEAGSSIADYNAFWQNGANYAGTQPGVHDINADPLFVDPANGDVSLMCNSPCIDKGDPANTGFSGKAIDIGAFEYNYFVGNATTAYGDASVNIGDVVFLVNYIFLSGPAPCPIGAGLIDCSEVITMSDIAYLINFLYAHGPEPCTSSQPQ